MDFKKFLKEELPGQPLQTTIAPPTSNLNNNLNKNKTVNQTPEQAAEQQLAQQRALTNNSVNNFVKGLGLNPTDVNHIVTTIMRSWDTVNAKALSNVKPTSTLSNSSQPAIRG